MELQLQFAKEEVKERTIPPSSLKVEGFFSPRKMRYENPDEAVPGF